MDTNTKKSPSEEYKKAFRDGFNEALRIVKCDIDDLELMDEIEQPAGTISPTELVGLGRLFS